MGGWLILFLLLHLHGWSGGSELGLHLGTLCPFRLITGLPCPGCGMTRAFLHLAWLEPRAALCSNPWSIPLFAYLAAEAAGFGPRMVPWLRRLWPLLLGAVALWWVAFRLLTPWGRPGP